MKHVIEVPAGHTVQISRHGNSVTVESAESNDQLSPVGGIKLAGASSPLGNYVNFGDEMFGFNALVPGDVVSFKTLVGSEWLTTIAVKGTFNRYSVSLTENKTLLVGSNCLVPCYVRKASPKEREEFLNNLRDWYALTITETGELINWRAKQSKQYYYIDTEGRVSGVPEFFDNCDSLGYKLGNYFPEGFLTDERLTEYKATVQKLFNKWRGLCNE